MVGSKKMAPKVILKKCSICGVSKPRDGFSTKAFYSQIYKERKCKACIAAATEASGGAPTGRPSAATLRALALQQPPLPTGLALSTNFSSPQTFDPLRPSASTKSSGRTVLFDSPSSEDDQSESLTNPSLRMDTKDARRGPNYAVCVIIILKSWLHCSPDSTDRG